MTDESNLPAPSPETPETEDGFAAVMDALGDAVPGIPAPIRKNLQTALARLCTALVDVPVAMLEGKASEKRAEAQARVRLIATSAEQIAKQMSVDPEYVQAAAKKFAHRVVREQINVDTISMIAVDQLRSGSTVDWDAEEAGKVVPDISLDWLNVFERAASQMSSEQMRRLFGKILAGEIRRPSSFSIKTIGLIAELDGRAAGTFRKLCSLSISLRIPKSNHVFDARVASLGGNAGQNSLGPYGLNFDNLNLLQEYGLIISDYNSYMDYRPAIVFNDKVAMPLTFELGSWALMPKVDKSKLIEPFTPPPFQVHGVALSRAGKELLPIVDLVSDDNYRTALKAFFDGQGYSLIPVLPSEGG